MTVAHRLVADPEGVHRRVRQLADDVSASHASTHADGTTDGSLVLVGVLKGSVPFLADLARELAVAVAVDFVAVSSYRPETARVRLVKDIELDVSGRSVVLVHDVVHTGLTTAYLVGELRRRGARSVEVCALVDRDARRIVPVDVHHVGFRVGHEYVVGMGLDHRGLYRNIGALVAVDEAALDANPDALLGDLYGTRDHRAVPGQAAGSWR